MIFAIKYADEIKWATVGGEHPQSALVHMLAEASENCKFISDMELLRWLSKTAGLIDYC